VADRLEEEPGLYEAMLMQTLDEPQLFSEE